MSPRRTNLQRPSPLGAHKRGLESRRRWHDDSPHDTSNGLLQRWLKQSIAGSHPKKQSIQHQSHQASSTKNTKNAHLDARTRALSGSNDGDQYENRLSPVTRGRSHHGEIASSSCHPSAVAPTVRGGRDGEERAPQPATSAWEADVSNAPSKKTATRGKPSHGSSPPGSGRLGRLSPRDQHGRAGPPTPHSQGPYDSQLARKGAMSCCEHHHHANAPQEVPE
jgi:hypothetical protein